MSCEQPAPAQAAFLFFFTVSSLSIACGLACECFVTRSHCFVLVPFFGWFSFTSLLSLKCPCFFPFVFALRFTLSLSLCAVVGVFVIPFPIPVFANTSIPFSRLTSTFLFVYTCMFIYTMLYLISLAVRVCNSRCPCATVLLLQLLWACPSFRSLVHLFPCFRFVFVCNPLSSGLPLKRNGILFFI